MKDLCLFLMIGARISLLFLCIHHLQTSKKRSHSDIFTVFIREGKTFASVDNNSHWWATNRAMAMCSVVKDAWKFTQVTLCDCFGKCVRWPRNNLSCSLVSGWGLPLKWRGWASPAMRYQTATRVSYSWNALPQARQSPWLRREFLQWFICQ